MRPEPSASSSSSKDLSRPFRLGHLAGAHACRRAQLRSAAFLAGPPSLPLVLAVMPPPHAWRRACRFDQSRVLESARFVQVGSAKAPAPAPALRRAGCRATCLPAAEKADTSAARPAPLRAAPHQAELPKRLARRLMDLQLLPYIVVNNPNIKKVGAACRAAGGMDRGRLLPAGKRAGRQGIAHTGLYLAGALFGQRAYP